MTDCGFTKENMWFRCRACAIIVEKGHVLFVGNDRDDYLYSVGGGIRHGERAEDAVVREVMEETGVKYEIDRLAVVQENFFENSAGLLEGLSCHEISFCFLMKPRGTMDLPGGSVTSWGEQEHLHWIPVGELDKHKAYPLFLKEYLANMPKGISHIVTDERKAK